MLASVLLLIPVFVCGTLGAAIGYFFRYQVKLRRFMTVVMAIFVLLVLEITSGTLSSKNTLSENLAEQPALLPPFLFLYLLPATFGSLFIAQRFRTWSQ
jgi:hypothetical protein